MFFMAAGVFDCSAQEGESFSTLQNRLGSGFGAEKNEAAASWDALEKAQQTQWARLKQEVERKWQTFVRSTRRDWVDYNDQRDTRSRVDFKEGTIEIETVVPEEDPEILELAKKKISEQIKKVFQKKDGCQQTCPRKPGSQQQRDGHNRHGSAPVHQDEHPA